MLDFGPGVVRDVHHDYSGGDVQKLGNLCVTDNAHNVDMPSPLISSWQRIFDVRANQQVHWYMV